MKKILKKLTIKEWIIYISAFILPIVLLLLLKKGLDNDIWYLLAEGKYIIQNGIYHVDPLSMHADLAIVVQNWLSAVIFWILYAFLGSSGIFVTVIIANFFICFLLYKICMVISKKNKILSIIIMLVTDLNLCLYFVVSRPQIFSFIILLLAIYLLELYIETNKNKYIYYLPLLSFLEINLHASLWWMLILFIIPYLFDSFKNQKLQLQGYNKKPLFIIFIITLLVGFINPYGLDAITFIFRSYGDKYMLTYINELQPLTINSFIGAHMIGVIIITTLFYVFFRDGKIRVRYIMLYCGTVILGFISIKGLSHFILVAIFPIALLLKDKVPKDFSNAKKILKKLSNFFVPLIGLACLGLLIFSFIKSKDKVLLENNAKDAMDLIDFFTGTNTATVYASFNNGGYVEFRGYKAYIDPRAEVFLKINNKKEDIHSEYYDFQFGKIDVATFLNKYNFDFLLVDITDRLYLDMDMTNYIVVYDDISTLYKVYARNDLFPEEFRKMLVEEYNKSKQKNQELIDETIKNQNSTK